LEAAAKRADDNFPANEYLRIENGEPVLKRLPRKPEPEGLLRLEQQLRALDQGARSTAGIFH
jgi:hypothetical protein